MDPGARRDSRGLQALGIGRKTGYRWRAERGGLAPLRRVEHERSQRYLSLLERQRIVAVTVPGRSRIEIAVGKDQM